jgi:hypothetical protein
MEVIQLYSIYEEKDAGIKPSVSIIVANMQLNYKKRCEMWFKEEQAKPT